MRAFIGRVATSVCVAAFFFACGGATDSDLFSGGTSGNDSGSITQHDSGSGGNDATTGTDSGGAGDGGVIVVDAGKDTGVVIDAGPLDPGIYCGKDQGQNVYCHIGQAICCATNQGQGTTQFKCQSASACNSGSAAIMACDDTVDCAGSNQVCCGIFDGQRYSKLSCTAAASCNTTGPNGETLYQICDPFLQPSDCPQGTTCGASSVLTGYYLCR